MLKNTILALFLAGTALIGTAHAESKAAPAQSFSLHGLTLGSKLDVQTCALGATSANQVDHCQSSWLLAQFFQTSSPMLYVMGLPSLFDGGRFARSAAVETDATGKITAIAQPLLLTRDNMNLALKALTMKLGTPSSFDGKGVTWKTASATVRLEMNAEQGLVIFASLNAVPNAGQNLALLLPEANYPLGNL